eukprot:tig00022104_g23826.t1
MTPLLFTNTDFLATAYCKTIQEHGRHAPHIFAVAAHILGGPAPFGQTADLTEELTVEDGHRPEELPEPPPVEELEGIPTRDPPPVHPATTTKKYMHVLVKLHGALSFFLEPLPGELGNIIIDYVRSHEDELHFRFTASGEVARSAKLDKWYEVEYPDCERVDPAHLITAFESLLHKATNDWLAVQIKHETPPAAREDVDMDRNTAGP